MVALQLFCSLRAGRAAFVSSLHYKAKIDITLLYREVQGKCKQQVTIITLGTQASCCEYLLHQGT